MNRDCQGRQGPSEGQNPLGHQSVRGMPMQPSAPPACSFAYNHISPPNYHALGSPHRIFTFSTTTEIFPELTPTVLYNPNFNAVNDAESLQKAMNGFRPNKAAIISILSNRTNKHRQAIANSFETLYKKDLIKELRSKLMGRFKDLIVAMMTQIADYYVKELHDSIWGMSSNEDILMIIFGTLRNQDIHLLSSKYNNMYGESLKSHIRGITMPDFFDQLLESLCDGRRNESTYTDIISAKYEAIRLLNAGIGRLGTNESQFHSILVKRSIHQLRLIFQEFSKIGGDISFAIDSAFRNPVRKDLLALVKCVENSSLYFSEQLYNSLSGIRTDDQKIIFICVTRSEMDMGDIKTAFHQKYGVTLNECILQRKDIADDYKTCLIELIS